MTFLKFLPRNVKNERYSNEIWWKKSQMMKISSKKIQKITKNGKFWLILLNFKGAFLFFKSKPCWNLFKLVDMYGVRSIVNTKCSWDCSIEYEDRILGMGGGQKVKKWLKRIPASIFFPSKNRHVKWLSSVGWTQQTVVDDDSAE